MHYTSKALSQELYELSEWQDTYWKWCEIDPGNWQLVTDSVKYLESTAKSQPWAPAYDLGFLIRKLPEATYIYRVDDLVSRYICLNNHHNIGFHRDETPEDAACRMAITMINQGILPAGKKDEK